MEDSFIEYQFTVQPLQPATEILIAELGELGFDSFLETKEGLLAYIKKSEWDSDKLEQVSVLNNADFKIDYKTSEIDQQNWNAEWEANFDPIILGRHCAVRAPFHQKPQVKYDIVIAPKNEFWNGTS